MGVAKAWRFSVISANLALLQNQNGHNNNTNTNANANANTKTNSNSNSNNKHVVCSRPTQTPTTTTTTTTSFQRKPISWSWDVSRREPIDIWKSKYSKYFYSCSERGRHFASAVRERSSNGYLLIATSGGLNQQRTGITDAVIVARILNATLVVPELDHHSYWKDDSDFINIFNVDWFISTLAKDVTIVRRVPDKVMRSMEKPPYTMRVPRKSAPEYYLDQVLPILLRRRCIFLIKLFVSESFLGTTFSVFEDR
ncbi:o-fucosyltransferase 29 [Quercus suber]|uniref:O-fucosyltransferase family protein n=1 Tax=Quercus suber TaxID=58331 RepID=A0AAW0L7V5_QUESU